MPTESAVYFFGPFPNGDPSLNTSPLLDTSSLQSNQEPKFKMFLDHSVTHSFWDWEARIYKALSPHKHILKSISLVHCPDRNDNKLWFWKLEKAPHGNLRDRITQGNAPPMAIRMRMALDLADTLQHIHSREIIWGATSTRNIFLFDNFHIKVNFCIAPCQFDNPSIGFREQDRFFKVLLLCESRYWAPGHDCLTFLDREMFMLGSCICEITEWAIPYGNIDDENLDEKLMNEEYPHVSEGNPAKDVIQKLWSFKYSSAQEVSDDIRKLVEQMNAEDWEMDQEWVKL